MNQADTAWMLVSTALVLLMTPALAFFYGGLVRSKNVLNAMMMSFVSLGFVGVLWATAGYSTSRVFLRGVGLEPPGSIPHLLFMCYQATFAIITAALISGASHGKQEGRTAVYRGQEYEVTLLPKMLVECVVPDHLVESVIQTVIESARTGQIGDGRVFVTPVTASYRIRTSERE
jgi:nitrogen regulatory protein PII